MDTAEKVEVIDQRTRPGRGIVMRFNGAPTRIVDDPNEITADDWYDLDEKWLPPHKVVVDRARFDRLLGYVEASEALARRFRDYRGWDNAGWSSRVAAAAESLKPGDLDPLPE